MVDQEFKEFFMCQTFNISLIYDVWVKMTISWIIEQKKVLRFLNSTYNNPAFIYNLFKLYTWLYIIKLSCQEYGIYLCVVFVFCFFLLPNLYILNILLLNIHVLLIFFFSFHFTVVRIENEICQGETRRRRNMCWIAKDFSFELKRYRHLNFVKSTSAIIKSQPGLFSFKSSP